MAAHIDTAKRTLGALQDGGLRLTDGITALSLRRKGTRPRPGPDARHGPRACGMSCGGANGDYASTAAPVSPSGCRPILTMWCG